MHFISAGLRALIDATVGSDPLWPAVTLLLLSVLITASVGAVRASRR
ncbi:hypothetical protein [Kitasatospora sp. NPDC088346]